MMSFQIFGGFSAPGEEVFNEQVLHSFQLKILRQEINRAQKSRKIFKENLKQIGIKLRKSNRK